MRQLNINIVLACIALAIGVGGCKDDDDGSDINQNEIADKVLTVLTVQDDAAHVYEDALIATQDSTAALNAVGQWLLDQPEVTDAYFWGPDLIEVNYKNGLTSNLLIVSSDANGQHITRGGGSGNSLNRTSSPTAINAPIKIENNKVLILNPFMESMYDGVYNKKNLFGADFEVDVFNDEDVTYGLLSTLSDYGLIIINTHGVPNGFFLMKSLTLNPGDRMRDLSREDILDLIKVQMGMPLEKFDENELQFDMLLDIDGYHISHQYAMINVTDKYITNAPITLDNAIVYGNHCYSGYTHGTVDGNMPAAWRSKGAATYYGYAYTNNSSGPVLNEYAKQWEDTLIVNLVKGDTTGIAHLDNDVTKMSHLVSARSPIPVLVQRGISYTAQPPLDLYFSQFYEPNYTYKVCADTLVDPRDNQKYPTVCIGNQVWMAKNLNWAGAGTCYEGFTSNCDLYGRLYTGAEITGGNYTLANPSGVQGICPQGWHVPSDAEWWQLSTHVGGWANVFTKLRSKSGWDNGNGTDEYGFNALPGGEYTEFGSYYGVGERTNFGTTYRVPVVTTTDTTYKYRSVSFRAYASTVDSGEDQKVYCRCLKD